MIFQPFYVARQIEPNADNLQAQVFRLEMAGQDKITARKAPELHSVK